MKSRILINCFIISYFAFVIVWLWLKAPTQLRPAKKICKLLNDKLESFAVLTGFEQYWALFSPNVKTENAYNLVVITYRNGLLKLYELPRMEQMDLLTKTHHEKYRKLFVDNMPLAPYMHIRPAVARFIAKANNEPNNPPVRIAYFLITTSIPAPEKNLFGMSNGNKLLPPPKTSIGKYFVYGVGPRDLSN